jgi:hypothetical protein
MKKLLGIIVLSLLLSGNAYAETMNEWIDKGYKVKNEDIVTSKNSRTATKVYTLINKRGYVVICAVRIYSSSGVGSTKCKKQ